MTEKRKEEIRRMVRLGLPLPPEFSEPVKLSEEEMARLWDMHYRDLARERRVRAAIGVGIGLLLIASPLLLPIVARWL